MSYCQNCGAKIESAENYCSFCGFKFEISTDSSDKDAKIHELEQKVARLEQRPIQKTPSSSFSPWMAILPIGFVAAFLGFFALIIWIVRQ